MQMFIMLNSINEQPVENARHFSTTSHCKCVYEMGTDSPQVKHPPELRVSSIQELVGSVRPCFINGGHGRDGVLKPQEVFLHLKDT